MSYFEDLSEYTCPGYRRINVGWMELGHPLPTGPAPAGFAAVEFIAAVLSHDPSWMTDPDSGWIPASDQGRLVEAKIR